MSFELSAIYIEEEGSLHLVHPATEAPLYAPVKKGEDTESKPVLLWLRSQSSPAYKKAVDLMMKKAAKRGKREPTSEEMREQSVEFLTALSIRIDNLTVNGEVVDTPDAFRKLYSDEHYAFVRQQANDFLGRTEAFLK